MERSRGPRGVRAPSRHLRKRSRDHDFPGADARPGAALPDPEARILAGSVHDDAHAPESEVEDEDEDGEKLLIDWYGTRNNQPDRLDLAIVDKATGKCVGEAMLDQRDPGNESRDFRILIGPTGRDRGPGTEAARLIAGYGFERLGLHRISLEVYAFNPRPSRRREGRLPRRGRAAQIPPPQRRVARRHAHIHPRPRMGPGTRPATR